MNMEADIGVTWPQAKEDIINQQLEETKNGFFSRTSEGSGPCLALVLVFWPAELQENKYLLFVAICHSSPGN